MRGTSVSHSLGTTRGATGMCCLVEKKGLNVDWHLNPEIHGYGCSVHQDIFSGVAGYGCAGSEVTVLPQVDPAGAAVYRIQGGTGDPNPVVLAARIRFSVDPVRPASISERERRRGMGLHLTKKRYCPNHVSLKAQHPRTLTINIPV